MDTDMSNTNGNCDLNPVTDRACNYFGRCPHCACGEDQSHYVNVGRSHFFVCDVHRTFWWIGSNLFSSWRDETEEDWRRNAALLDTCREVEPVWCRACSPMIEDDRVSHVADNVADNGSMPF
jgi:hypothetical protein